MGSLFRNLVLQELLLDRLGQHNAIEFSRA